MRWHTSTASSVESYLKSYDSDNIFSKSKLFKLSVPVMINAHLSRYFRETGEIVYTNQELDWSRWPLLKMHMSIFTWSLLFMYFQTLQGSHKIDWLLFLKQRKWWTQASTSCRIQFVNPNCIFLKSLGPRLETYSTGLMEKSTLIHFFRADKFTKIHSIIPRNSPNNVRSTSAWLTVMIETSINHF